MRALRRVLARSSSFHEERPVARLRQEKFARQLFQDAARLCAGVVFMRTRDFYHPPRGRMQMRINPRIASVQPNLEITFVPPARSCGSDDLLRGIMREIFARRYHLEILLIVGSFA